MFQVVSPYEAQIYERARQLEIAALTRHSHHGFPKRRPSVLRRLFAGTGQFGPGVSVPAGQTSETFGRFRPAI